MDVYCSGSIPWFEISSAKSVQKQPKSTKQQKTYERGRSTRGERIWSMLHALKNSVNCSASRPPPPVPQPQFFSSNPYPQFSAQFLTPSMAVLYSHSRSDLILRVVPRPGGCFMETLEQVWLCWLSQKSWTAPQLCVQKSPILFRLDRKSLTVWKGDKQQRIQSSWTQTLQLYIFGTAKQDSKLHLRKTHLRGMELPCGCSKVFKVEWSASMGMVGTGAMWTDIFQCTMLIVTSWS